MRPMFARAKGKLWLFAGIVMKRGRPLLGKLGSLFVDLWHHLLPLIHRCTSWNGFWWIAGIAVVLAIGVYLSWRFWDDLQGGPESLSTTVRNLGLVIGGVIAILLAVWRSVVGSSQADTAQRSLQNERYQKGAEMLGNNVLSVRLGGVYALRRLAEEHPEQYHVQIMRLFCAFVRNPTETNTGEDSRNTEEVPPHTPPSLREDVQTVMMAIGNRSSVHLHLEAQTRLQLDMRGSDLRGAELSDMNLTTPPWQDWARVPFSELLNRRTDLSDAKLCSANLTFAELKNAKLWHSCLCNTRLGLADLSDAVLADANLHGALWSGPILSGAKFSFDGFSPAKGIKQSDLDSCQADADNLPDLTGVVDAETGEPLVWSGKPLDAKS